MSRYKVQYLPGGIQRDVGLAVRMRREEPDPEPSEDCACTPEIDGVFWLVTAGTWTGTSPAAIGDLDDRLGLRVLGALCQCELAWSVEVDDGSNTYTWESGGAWSPSPPWGDRPPLEFADGIALGGDLQYWLVYNPALVTVTPTVCGEAQEAAVLDTGGA